MTSNRRISPGTEIRRDGPMPQPEQWLGEHPWVVFLLLCSPAIVGIVGELLT